MNTAKEYRRIMLGRKSANADDGLKGGWIAAGYIDGIDLTGQFPLDWKEFNAKMRDVWLEQNPGKSKVAAGLACAMLYTICHGASIGDVVMTPDTEGNIHFGEISGDYIYDPTYELPHKRPVRWYGISRHRNELSDGLQNSLGSTGTVSNVTKHSAEIKVILDGQQVAALTAVDPDVEDVSVFALEQHLESFLIANWAATPLGKSHNLYTIDGENIGQQFPTDTGPIDILAISKDGKELLVVELKRGRASDRVVGQIQRYMGYVQAELAEQGQTVRGVIIALEDDLRLKRALSVAPNITFFRYQVSFQLLAGGTE
ncbi:endonuclease NucS domain-containing protein [Pseudogemmobacter sp. W21_MBD1_M6]|uniref:endonuclease NucS domain-containing protein n=1 Tax=Pseudogemmobacter sp. W21_MBD1_M6 TaxID=3240271 RepID=UPI003F9E3C3C